MSDPSPAVFLSYASQDAEAAARLCTTLRAAGIEVWFDQNELVGGDAWDAKIRGQLKACALFLPLISAATQSRLEGYFRLEWKLAAQRTHTMADAKPFLVPVVIDATRDAEAHVPEEFRAVQWTRLPAGEAPPAFVQRIQTLLGSEPPVARVSRPVIPPSATSAAHPSTPNRRPLLLAVATLALAGAVTTAAFLFSRRSTPTPITPPSTLSSALTSPAPAAAPVMTSAATLNPKGIAVLPFENLSPDPAYADFADGMHDEVITALHKVRDLTVPVRAAVLDYRGPAKPAHRQIATTLGVANILEGRVRRMGNQVRVTVELIDARTGTALWNDAYTEEGTDVFKIWSKLAAAITSALKSTLTPAEQSQIARRPTLNQEAYDLYLRARRWRELPRTTELNITAKWEEVAIRPLERAVTLDPKFALAFAELGMLHSELYWWPFLDPTPARLAQAKACIDTALQLDPALPSAHLALAYYHYFGSLDYSRATEEYAIALAGMPGDADALGGLAATQRRQGRWTEAAANFERAFIVNPRNSIFRITYVETLFWQRLYRRAGQIAARILEIDPADSASQRQVARARYASDGDLAAYVSALAAVSDASTTSALIGKFEHTFFAGRYDEATQLFESAPEQFVVNRRQRQRQQQRYCHSLRALGAGEKSENYARAAALEASQRPTEHRTDWVRLAHLATMQAYAGQADAARHTTTQLLELLPHSRDAVDGGYALYAAACVHVVLGDHDRALGLLDQALSNPLNYSANEIRYLEPWWKPLQADPRFQAALAKAAPRD